MARVTIQPFRWEQSDPLANEHQLLESVVTDAVQKGFLSGTDIELARTEAGRTIQASDAEQGALLVCALLKRMDYLQRVRDFDFEPKPGPEDVLDRKNQRELHKAYQALEVTQRLLQQLLRRKLSLTREHFGPMLEGFTRGANFLSSFPWKWVIKYLELFGAIPPEAEEVRRALAKMRDAIDWEGAEASRLRTRIEAMLEGATSAEVEEGNAKSSRSNIMSNEIRKEVADLLKSANEVAKRKGMWALEDIFSIPAAKKILEGDHELQRAAILLTAEHAGEIGKRERTGKSGDEIWTLNIHHADGFPSAGMEISRKLLHKKLPLSDEDVAHIAEDLGEIRGLGTWSVPMLEPMVGLLEKRVNDPGTPAKFLKGIKSMHTGLARMENAPERKLRERLERLMNMPTNSGPAKNLKLPIYPGEAWSDMAIAEVQASDGELKEKWAELLEHCRMATSAAPSGKWEKRAREMVMGLGKEEFLGRVLKWFPLVDKPRTQPLDHHHAGYSADTNEMICEPHMDILRGLAWCCAYFEGREVARGLADLGRSCYRKIRLQGPRASRVGNATVTALGAMPGLEGVYQLSYLKVKVKFGTAQKMIEKAFNAAAERAGLQREEIEELAVPSYGLTEVGVAEEKLGELTARLQVMGTDSAVLVWMKEDGKTQKAVPAAVKENFAEELKEFKASVKDIERMLPVQRDRIDGMFLQQRVWPVKKWRERYLEHPLVGTLARRILWEFGEFEDLKFEISESKGGGNEVETQRARRAQRENAKKTGLWFEGRLVDLDLRPIELKDEMAARLWHPIGKSLEEVQAWRGFLEEHGIVQPFKQAHREIYLLTEAELRTETYSNRFAAHVVKQHQFNALCAARGWKNSLRLLVDAEYLPPTLYLPQWGLRAEFWVEGIGTDYGTDTTDSGAYLRLATDQVRFYRVDAAQRSAHAGGGGYHPGYQQEDAEPVPVREIPDLVFSEVMRDVDLFVGVSSVGNDPTWSDGGPNGRFVEYWRNYSFGELNASAKTRLDVLKRLIPKLKIAKVCSFEEKFLLVKGSLRTYRIHLGSGNILMAPNDQYLCIVPKQGVETMGSGVMLPFEGDRTLSVILSKAFLLAEDAKIKDSSIVSQISGKS